jgi:excisionase family DNA binding protein
MLALFTFFVGVVLLFKGGFSFFGRTVGKPQSRLIALALMAPLVLEFCVSTMLAYNNMQITPDGAISISPDAFASIADTLSGIEIISVLVAIGFAVFTVFGSPQIGTLTPPAQRPQPTSIPQRAPDIMTVAEAAAYMRVSETEVMNLINEGKLGAARIGSTYRIARIAIDDFMGTSA